MRRMTTSLLLACALLTMSSVAYAQEASEAPGASDPPMAEASADPGQSAEPTAPTGEGRVIEFQADETLRYLQEGEPMLEIAVTPGESVVFRIDNTAGFAHNFYIGADEELSLLNGLTDVGIPDWETGVQELEWVVPEDISNLRFACTVPGHYILMQGDFVVTP